MSQTFKPAPAGTVAIVWTLGFIGAFVFFTVRVLLAVNAGISPDLFDVGAGLLLAGFIVYGWARSVKSYRVDDSELNIERALIKGVSVPLEKITSAQTDPEIRAFSNASIFGSGGLFGWGGRTTIQRPSDVYAMPAYAYGANPKNSVILRTDGGKNIVVTPADPQAFVAAIREASKLRDPQQVPTPQPSKKRNRR